MDYNTFFQSKLFKRIVVGVGLLIIMLLAFGAGLSVGYRKARFSYAWGENYDRNFGGPQHGIFGFLSEQESEHGFMNAHGTFGSVLSISAGSSTLVINGRDNAEKTVRVSSSTAFRARRDAIQFSDIKIGDPVVVIGAPNDQGQIEAKLIRLLK